MIIIFCGIPGSGKTTIAKRLVEHLRKQGSVKHFISDELKPPVYKKFFQILPENLGKYDDGRRLFVNDDEVRRIKSRNDFLDLAYRLENSNLRLNERVA